ncbi:unnamed protein product, partial [marine sediment metagenome]
GVLNNKDIKTESQITNLKFQTILSADYADYTNFSKNVLDPG